MKLAKLLVTFFFVGHSKIAPGSIARIATTLLFYFFAGDQKTIHARPH